LSPDARLAVELVINRKKIDLLMTRTEDTQEVSSGGKYHKRHVLRYIVTRYDGIWLVSLSNSCLKSCDMAHQHWYQRWIAASTERLISFWIFWITLSMRESYGVAQTWARTEDELLGDATPYLRCNRKERNQRQDMHGRDAGLDPRQTEHHGRKFSIWVMYLVRQSIVQP